MKQKFLILLGIILFLIIVSFLWRNQAVEPADPTNKTPVTFMVNKGESARSIAERLKKEGLIRSPVAFFLLARFTGLGDNIQAGQFMLSPAMDMDTVATSLTHGTIDTRITIPEGWRIEEIALKLAGELAIPESEFLKAAREGYMFPDTYSIPKNVEASDAAKIFISNFENKIKEVKILMVVKERKLSLDDTIIIASMVEREAKFNEDKPLVASVILNRLRLGMKLDIDASIQYALGYQPKDRTWWKKELTLDDLNIDSPYNTYRNAGLPPKPIANPGLDAITAVYNAPENDFLYYVSDKTGKLHFAKDIEGHNINISKYLNK